ncbi:hypothetical protein ACJMK2_037056 [Sinanodonta woodiana]|uniref:Uncharacterized protein n=1 Tax=Sinanodonta woodiana TaxID=1069815 RepID=A0ABD3WML6_SINWO
MFYRINSLGNHQHRINSLGNHQHRRIFTSCGTCEVIPVATIDNLKRELNKLNLNNYLIINEQVGGNDVDRDLELKHFAVKYMSFINQLLVSVDKVVIHGLVPRSNVNMTQYDDMLLNICRFFLTPYT